MKTVEIVGFKREDVGTKFAKLLREEGQVPCVLYGGENEVHFYVPVILFKDLVYTHEAKFVLLNIEGYEVKAILQDVQFHPVSEMILHADFLQLDEKTPVKMDIPVVTKGNSKGVIAGGVLYIKNRKLTVKSLPKDMPENIEVDVTELDLGKTIKVKELTTNNYEILTNPNVSVVVVNIPRTLKSAMAQA